MRVLQPSLPLRNYVSHYWLSLNNSDQTFSILPDGAVDVVIAARETNRRLNVFGTTTLRTELPIEVGAHYLGIRFRPGQSRHFMNVLASELTDAVHPAAGLFVTDVCEMADSMAVDRLLTQLDSLLISHLKYRPPQDSRIDCVVRHIEATQGMVPVAQLADMFGKSRRQFERHFFDVVGLSPKLFAQIVRFQRASNLLANSSWPLVQIAMELGFSDQSHFTHEFGRFFGQPPSRARRDVAFLQDMN
ncbi:MAG: helix-turn-helix transcriptional regulator [Natronospirillum sp.]